MHPNLRISPPAKWKTRAIKIFAHVLRLRVEVMPVQRKA